MARFKIGQRVEVDNPERADYGHCGKVENDYRSGAERQGYGVQWDNGAYYWIHETDLKRWRAKRKAKTN